MGEEEGKVKGDKGENTGFHLNCFLLPAGLAE